MEVHLRGNNSVLQCFYIVKGLGHLATWKLELPLLLLHRECQRVLLNLCLYMWFPELLLMLFYVTANRAVTPCVSFPAFYQIPCVLKLELITLSNTYKEKQTITCKLISRSSGVTATDRQAGKKNFLCRVTYFFFPQFCHRSWRWNLLNSLFVQRLLYCEWKSYCFDRLQRNDRNKNDHNKSNNIYFLHSFHLLRIHFAPCNVLGLLRDTWEVNSVAKKAFVTTITLLLLWTGFAQPSLTTSKSRLLEAQRGFSIPYTAHVHPSPGSVDNGSFVGRLPLLPLPAAVWNNESRGRSLHKKLFLTS